MTRPANRTHLAAFTSVGCAAVLANRILNLVTAILAWPTLPVQVVTTSVGGCLISLTFGLLLIPLGIIWNVFFLWPLLGLSWAWDKVPLLRIPLAIVGIPLAAVGATYVALVPSMGDMGSRVMKLVLCETWPFSLDFWRSLRGIEVRDYERFTRIKYVMWGLRAGPPPDTTTSVVQVISDDGTHIASGIEYLGRTWWAESTLMGEIRQPGIGDVVGPNRKLTVRSFSPHKLDSPLSEYSLTEYEVEPDVIKFKLDEAALRVGPF